jgi:4'-phosphopantetheinyl transferase
VQEVRVWWARAEPLAGAEALLSGPGRARLQAVEGAAVRDEFLSAHLLLRAAVAAWAAARPADVEVDQVCARCGGPHGRPVVTVRGRPGPSASVSRAGGLAVVAVGNRPLGVDVEPLQPTAPGFERVALSPLEQAQLDDREAADRDELLVRWWVRKEAVLKATGHGLEVDPRHVVVTPPDEAPRLVGWTGPGRRPVLQLHDVDLGPGRAAAVAVHGRRRVRPMPVEVRLSALAW